MEIKRPVLVCLYEDRPYQAPGVKLLVLTLARYCPSWPIRLRFPGISDAFRSWLQRFPQVTLLEERLPSFGSFNVKPSVLLDALASGAETCLWIDTDILVNGNLDFIHQPSADTVIATQDPWEYEDGSTHRSTTWGLTPGRSLPGPLNSSVVRVSRQHEEFLQAWHRILCTPEYLAEQKKPVRVRNKHILSDQDGLSALLASQEFAHFPVVRLRHATQILQHHGAGAYGPAQRWSNLTQGMPPLLHAMGSVKPWSMPDRPGLFSAPRDYYERTYLELSPYVHFARQYRPQLEEDNSGWLDIRTISGSFGTLAAFNRPALKGIVQATLHRALPRG